MIRKVTETKYKYDDKGNVIEKTETITEYDDINYAPLSPYPVPSNPYYKEVYYEIPKTPKYNDITITCNSKCNFDEVSNKVLDGIKSTFVKEGFCR